LHGDEDRPLPFELVDAGLGRDTSSGMVDVGLQRDRSAIRRISEKMEVDVSPLAALRAVDPPRLLQVLRP
jgi:hypothetical protein